MRVPCKHCPYLSHYRLLTRDPVPRDMRAERSAIAEAVAELLKSGQELPVGLNTELCHMNLSALMPCSGQEWLENKLARERPALTYEAH